MWVRTLWPPCPSDRSLRLRGLEAKLLWWLQIYRRCFTHRTYGGRQAGEGGRDKAFLMAYWTIYTSSGSAECFSVFKRGRIRPITQWILHLFSYKGRVAAGCHHCSYWDVSPCRIFGQSKIPPKTLDCTQKLYIKSTQGMSYEENKGRLYLLSLIWYVHHVFGLHYFLLSLKGSFLLPKTLLPCCFHPAVILTWRCGTCNLTSATWDITWLYFFVFSQSGGRNHSIPVTLLEKACLWSWSNIVWYLLIGRVCSFLVSSHDKQICP